MNEYGYYCFTIAGIVVSSLCRKESITIPGLGQEVYLPVNGFWVNIRNTGERYDMISTASPLSLGYAFKQGVWYE